MPANLFLITILSLRFGALSANFLVAIVFGILWLNFAGYLIWYYDERVLPTFFNEAKDVFVEDDRLDELRARYDDFFSSYHFIPVSIWVLMLVGLFFGSESYLIRSGLYEPGSWLRYLYLGAVFYLGGYSGIGFMGVVTTVLAMRELTKLNLEVDPLHPDGLGGLSTIGYFAIRTTLTFSTGSLLLPLAFVFVRGNAPAWLVYLIVAGFTGAIAVSFVYPTWLINRKAQEERDRQLDQLRREYQTAQAELEDFTNFERVDEGTELAKRLELERLRREYQDYKSVRLYPFKIDIILKLVSSVLLPLMFLIIDQHLI